uniref:Zonadhesin-like isoform X2 n=1 Tax=Dermatophagoides pteronyssinus TaxID=6956 RepID=A0A6P6YE59_DERPT|nr:zonadhesin-like isoform X2 [Dermatophagoides pteronyssinus]
MLTFSIWKIFALSNNDVCIRSNTWHSRLYLKIFMIIFVCFITTTININANPMINITDQQSEIEVNNGINISNNVDDNEQVTTSIPSVETTTNEFISSTADQESGTTKLKVKTTFATFDFDDPICDPKTEVLTNCSNACPKTCEFLDRKPCKSFCWKSCDCKPGYVKDYDLKCILPEECPKCENNENYKRCGSECEVTCETYRNPFPYCNRNNCKRGCFCNYGYVRDMSKNGTCIPFAECPNKCGPNEYWDVNGEPCIRTRENPRPKCLFEKRIPSCVCNTGFKRDPNTKECRPIATEPIKCEQNEIYSQCGSECAIHCSDENKRETCPTVCNRGCFCKDGYRRHANTLQCVLPEECGKKSNDNYGRTIVEFA